MKTVVNKFLIITCVLFFAISFSSCSKDDSTSDLNLNDDKSLGLDSDNASSYSYSTIELETLQAINSHRTSIGLSSLVKTNMVSLQAEGHTDYLITTGRLSHDNFVARDDYLIKNLPAKSIGENVASGYSDVDTLVAAWLNSPTHKAIIEDSRYTNTGISIKSDGNGKKYFVQIFVAK